MSDFVSDEPAAAGSNQKKQILCVSLTRIERDARVLRQIEMLAQLGKVATVGFGPQPPGSTTHFQVPDGLVTLPQTITGVAKLALRAHKAVECKAPAQSWVLSEFERLATAGRLPAKWDLVVSNDARVLDLTSRLAGGAPVWADMHEWAPEERTHITSWRLLVAPFMVYLCEKYLPNASLVTTVSHGIADLYRDRFGVEARLMPNAGPLKDIAIRPSGSEVIRCVHSGGAIHGRGLENMIRVFNALPERFTLDLYLVEGGDGGAHLRELQVLAAGNPRITFNDPVRPAELPATLNQYDLGIFWIPPTHTNARLTLPNKFFDYVQARIGMAIGPTVEMVHVLREHDLGVVSESFEVDDMIASMTALDRAAVERFKQSADHAAPALSFEEQTKPVIAQLRTLLAS